MTPFEIQNFLNKIRLSNGCWDWVASLSVKGYGLFKLNGKTVKAHRVSYELFKGEIPKGLQIDHLCRNRKCVNPSHLEAVTARINVLRGETITAKAFRTTKCPLGHPYSMYNTWFDNRGHRNCKICKTEKRNLPEQKAYQKSYQKQYREQAKLSHLVQQAHLKQESNR